MDLPLPLVAHRGPLLVQYCEEHETAINLGHSMKTTLVSLQFLIE
jgi:hypothetical protein